MVYVLERSPPLRIKSNGLKQHLNVKIMRRTKAQLIGVIYKAFEGVTLEEGIGLWEGYALDERLENTKEYYRLKGKDEREDWQKIPILDLYYCSSSISFLDAKGMRFHLGLYLLFALEVFWEEEEALHENEDFDLSPPEVQFALTYNLESDFSRERFSLLNKAQMKSVVYFLEYALGERKSHFRAHGITQKPSFDKRYKELENAIAFWKVKALVG
ncbi:DUF6714 family protein [Maribacter sp. 2-571]|uniref:DUF6714 family protein n=1 Tax=Maribacter sp. 2-571 TaxID=3417569 RepID=UPI003D355744